MSRRKVALVTGASRGIGRACAVELGAFGFDASKALPTDNPGRVCAMLASARDPMVFSGKDLDGPTFYAEHAGVSFGHPGENPSGE